MADQNFFLIGVRSFESSVDYRYILDFFGSFRLGWLHNKKNQTNMFEVNRNTSLTIYVLIGG